VLHGTGRYQAQQVLDGIDKLTLQTNKHGQFTHDAILLLQKSIQRVLVSQFNPSDPGKGMVKLLDDGNNILTQIQSTDASTAGSVLKSSKKRTDELSTTTGKTILPTFTTRTEAQEEADQLNVINQSVIGAKEGVVEAVSKPSPTPFYERRMEATSKASMTIGSTR
jgi:hypothetical protein